MYVLLIEIQYKCKDNDNDWSKLVLVDVGSWWPRTRCATKWMCRGALG